MWDVFGYDQWIIRSVSNSPRALHPDKSKLTSMIAYAISYMNGAGGLAGWRWVGLCILDLQAFWS